MKNNYGREKSEGTTEGRRGGWWVVQWVRRKPKGVVPGL